MILILADIHFGKADAGAERSKEKELVACLEFFADRGLSEVVLLGDVFEYYIEYRHLIPKGYSRFQGKLADLADAGVAISYFAGNHDPWHRDYFAREFGAAMFMDTDERLLGGMRYHFFHGDGAPALGGLYGKLKRVLRHPIPVSIYKSVLPGDVGVSLARWVNNKFSAKRRSMQTVDGLRKHAEGILTRKDVDIVVMGHSHFPEKRAMAGGLYLNPGSWHYQRTFALITDDARPPGSGPQLLEWSSAGPTAPDRAEESATTAAMPPATHGLKSRAEIHG